MTDLQHPLLCGDITTPTSWGHMQLRTVSLHVVMHKIKLL